jgi:hypothetical protein
MSSITNAFSNFLKPKDKIEIVEEEITNHNKLKINEIYTIKLTEKNNKITTMNNCEFLEWEYNNNESCFCYKIKNKKKEEEELCTKYYNNIQFFKIFTKEEWDAEIKKRIKEDEEMVKRGKERVKILEDENKKENILYEQLENYDIVENPVVGQVYYIIIDYELKRYKLLDKCNSSVIDKDYNKNDNDPKLNEITECFMKSMDNNTESTLSIKTFYKLKGQGGRRKRSSRRQSKRKSRKNRRKSHRRRRSL